MHKPVSPVLEKDRIVSLDIIRGFAILGIFLVNMLSFHSPFLYLDPFEWWSSPADKSTYVFIDIFVQASFYPLFSMLFGYGLVLLRERAIAKGLPFGGIAARRMSLLLLIGIFHAFLIWHGDILINYAIFGFIFLLFIKLSGKNMLLTGILLYVIPNLLFALLFFMTVMFVPAEELSIYDPAAAEASLQVYQNGSIEEITAQRMEDWLLVNNLASLPIMLASIFPLFLIGAGAAKLKWLEEPEKVGGFLRKLMIGTLAGGVFCKLLPYLTEGNLAVDFLQDIFGGPLLAIGYGVAIALAIKNGTVLKVMLPLSYVGKLSLSNYLLQSIISTLIFYSYGLGFYGEISALSGTLLVIFIFALQVMASRYWVSRYYYGPAEWLWRSFTYLKLPKWRRQA
ncbi:DUF418 domain-containing protein [Bacillus sp. ISL-47]|uniref:DUF418 domain-containing protein n=1 Tax=Bacillus sp. ISL-47 TaxID=2819130 RepID=UPI001BE8E520|nr:DUF418 domain-containing protein [Bacillus sp. ISL-47]MBT2688987.1 DUF418 domain-containing protein [Bacillus sp. ISL-47]MBT2708734.1 DUF418 domain-containing protein [Pseudomonas sp. ISL-84]